MIRLGLAVAIGLTLRAQTFRQRNHPYHRRRAGNGRIPDGGEHTPTTTISSATGASLFVFNYFLSING